MITGIENLVNDKEQYDHTGYLQFIQFLLDIFGITFMYLSLNIIS
jgi:hypothetical protein